MNKASGWLATAAALTAVAPAALPPVLAAVGRWREAHIMQHRLDAVAAAAAAGSEGARNAACAVSPIATDTVSTRRVEHLAPLLASWQTVGGCGAGASTGSGVKWIGRNVRGGLVHVECQANYVKMPYGYNYVGTALVSGDIGSWWNVGVSVPYLYKYINDPYSLDVDVSVEGLGDVNLLLGRRFGTIADWSATLSVGAPTGVHDARFRTQILPQERQLGHGRPTASLTLDHISDTDWGLVLLGGLVNWRGGENNVESYRAPAASLYGHLGYVLGPFTPVAGLTATGFYGRDRNLGGEQGTPIVSVAGNLSLEWATDWVAILMGASLPYDYVGRPKDFKGAGGLGAWVLALGVATAPF